MPLTEAQLDEIVRKLNVSVEGGTNGRASGAFGTFSELKEFFQAEVDFWQKYGQGLPKIVEHFRHVINSLKEAANQSDPNQAYSAIQLGLKPNKTATVYSDTPLAKFLADVHERNADAATAAYAYHEGNLRDKLLSDRDYLDGLIAAVAFHNPVFFSSAVDSRIKAFDEKTAEADEFRRATAENYREVKKSADAWKTATETSVQQLLSASKETFDSANLERSTEFQAFFLSCKQKIDDLRKLYEEKLRLERPATYWHSLEQDYTKKGRTWVGMSIAAVLLFAAAISLLVYQPPALFNDAKPTLGGVKGALLIAAAVSMLIYFINFLVKMATSSYHLARDARERYQLTHVFLALIKEQAIEPKDREIILSALFSRADTGLLRHDSSPTMPTPLGAVLDAIKGK